MKGRRECRQNQLSPGCLLVWESFMVPRELILQCYLQSRSLVFLKTTSRDCLLNSYPFMEPLLGRALGCALREAPG